MSDSNVGAVNMKERSIDEISTDMDAFVDGLDEVSEEDLAETLSAVEDESEDMKPPELPHIKFDAKELASRLKIFAPMDKSLTDILSRALLFRLTEAGKLEVVMSDGMFKAVAVVPYEAMSEEFYKAFVVDYDSLMKIISHTGSTCYIVRDEDSLYIDFYGGRVHLPTFNLDHNLIDGRVEVKFNQEGNPFVDVPAEQLLQASTVTRDFLTSCQIPNMFYMFIEPDAIILSTGFTVMRIKLGLGFTCTLRKTDISYLISICQMALTENLRYASDGRNAVFNSESTRLVIPTVKEQFPASYKTHLDSVDTTTYYAVEFKKLYLLLSILSKVYRASGVVKLKTEGGIMTLEAESQDGRVSEVVLSRSKVGDMPDIEILFSVNSMLSVLKSLRGFDSLNLAIKGSSLCLFNDILSLVVMGTESGIKSKVFNTKKEVKRCDREKNKRPKKETPAPVTA